MEVIKTEIEGVVIIEPRIFGDSRGYFFESFSAKNFKEQVADVDFVQDKESKSCYIFIQCQEYPFKIIRKSQVLSMGNLSGRETKCFMNQMRTVAEAVA